MMIKDKLEEKMNKKGKNSQIIQLEKLNTFEIKNLFDNLGAEMGNDYYGVFECILGWNTVYGNRYNNTIYLSNSGEVVIFSVPLRKFFLNEKEEYKKVF